MDFVEKLQQFKSTQTTESFTSQNDKVLLIDGLNNYLRSFAATPTMNDDGRHIGGLVGFLRSLGATIRQFKPSRCIVVFDGKGGSLRRRRLFKEYKENRKFMTKLNRTYDFNTPDDEYNSRTYQLIRLIEVLTHLPVTVISIDEVEADDVIAYVTKLVVQKNGDVLIMSTDKDFLQLVTSHVKIFNPIKKLIYDADKIVNDYGVHPNNFIVYRALDGDVSDNIPGIKGTGLKTLIKNFPELANSDVIPWEHIFSESENKTSKLCQNILANKSIIERNVSLMRLDEQHMSGSAKIKTLNLFDEPINRLNKLALTQLFVRDKLMGSFPNLDNWIMSTFTSLNRFSITG